MVISHPAPDSFRARHNIRATIDIPGVHVTSFPRRARNTNRGGNPVLAQDSEAAIRVAANGVHHAAATPSFIELPVLPE
jgi:predicted acyl esterase